MREFPDAFAQKSRSRHKYNFLAKPLLLSLLVSSTLTDASSKFLKS